MKRSFAKTESSKSETVRVTGGFQTQTETGKETLVPASGR